MTKVTILIDGGTGRVLGQKPPVVIPDACPRLDRGSRLSIGIQRLLSFPSHPGHSTHNKTGFPLTNGGNDGFGVSVTIFIPTIMACRRREISEVMLLRNPQ